MLESLAYESNDDCETLKTSRKRGGEDEEDEDGEESIEGEVVVDLTAYKTVSAAPAVTDQFMHTPDFRRHFVKLVHVQT
ncbi:hypothetical protein TrLO_g9504 [Triparma laevis f. longispina]|uniref:Uncharacterized protein n=1 Tax=Triparma laevis f. longispina TaxID=1714387 RepID=A0A9W7C2T5_9STRA|nr:hypothetical protein TrLO_g9504 [Triparma laevis f. longispina]